MVGVSEGTVQLPRHSPCLTLSHSEKSLRPPDMNSTQLNAWVYREEGKYAL